MKKVLLSFVLLIAFISNAFSNTEVINALKEGGKLVFIRHAYAPGGGDPENFNVNDCSTQRNLNSAGIEQAKQIGKIFKDNNILIDKKFYLKEEQIISIISNYDGIVVRSSTKVTKKIIEKVIAFLHF